MSLDAEGAEGYAAGDSPSYGAEIGRRVIAALAAAGHTDCSFLAESGYIVESGAAVCGCGVFAEYIDTVDQDAEAADRAAQRAARQRGGTVPYEAADPIASTLALIDPTEVYGPADVERHILDVLYRLETGALFERETVVKAWQTRQAYDIKFAATVHTSDASSADRRKAEAQVACEAEYREMADAAMMKEAVKQTMHNLRAILSGYQSTARSVGSAYQGGGSQGAAPEQPRWGR